MNKKKYCGRGGTEHGIETVGLARGGKKATRTLDPGPTLGPKLEDDR